MLCKYVSYLAPIWPTKDGRHVALPLLDQVGVAFYLILSTLIYLAVTIARMIGMAYEPGWKEMSPELREEWRRTWWGLGN